MYVAIQVIVALVFYVIGCEYNFKKQPKKDNSWNNNFYHTIIIYNLYNK